MEEWSQSEGNSLGKGQGAFSCTKLLVTQSCLTLCNLLDYSPPGSSVHWILQTRILEWVATSFYRGASWPRDQTQISCIAGRFFTVWATRAALPGRLQSTDSVSAEAHPQKTGNMCHLQDGAKTGIMKRYILFLPSDIIAKVMCLEWISPYYARKFYAGQISLGDFSDARQIATVLSIALSMPSVKRSCTLELTPTQQHRNLPGLFWKDVDLKPYLQFI